MRRRVTTLSARFGAFVSCLFLALSAFGQPTANYRIGFISPESEAKGRATFDAFRDGMHDLGYQEGRNLTIDARWGNGSEDRLDRYALELVQSKPNLIVTQTRAVFSIRRAGTSIPIVFAFSGDPVVAKLVDSLARPGGSLTGVSMLSLELAAKRIELLKELMPGMKRVAIIANPAHAGVEAEHKAAQTAAQALGLLLEYFPVRNAVELEAALIRIPKLRCEAIVVFPDAGTMTYSERLVLFTSETGIPAMSGWTPFAEDGNLVTYGPELRDGFRRLATYVDKILKGANPRDLPVELPTKFELTINLKTARALGLKIPQSVALRANRVIE